MANQIDRLLSLPPPIATAKMTSPDLHRRDYVIPTQMTRGVDPSLPQYGEFIRVYGFLWQPSMNEWGGPAYLFSLVRSPDSTSWINDSDGIVSGINDIHVINWGGQPNGPFSPASAGIWRWDPIGHQWHSATSYPGQGVRGWPPASNIPSMLMPL